jgi:cytochrome P450
MAEGTESKTDWPKGTRQLMGEESILMQSGRKHASQRRLLGQAFTREAVDGYAPLVEEAVRSNLENWAEQGCVKGLASGKDLAFEVAARALVASGGENEEDMSQETMEAFRHDFDRVVVSEEKKFEVFFFFFAVERVVFFSLLSRKSFPKKLTFFSFTKTEKTIGGLPRAALQPGKVQRLREGSEGQGARARED